MLAPDIPVWYRWLKQNGHLIQNLFYDCFLGGPFLTPNQEKDPMWIMWASNTAKRTDAIAETEKEVWIIEVSAYPGMRAIGQLITYQALWLEDPKIEKIERLLLIAERLDTDISAGAGKMGIQCHVMPAPSA